MKNLLTILAIFVAAVQLTAQPANKQQRIKAVENHLIPYVPVKNFPAWNLSKRMKYYKIPGMSIAVINNYKIDWAKSYGLADTSKKISATNKTMYSAGSISKLLTAVIAMKMVERGQLALDSPINKFLRSWQLSENDFTRRSPVTPRMLLSHTAGTSQSSYFGYLPSKKPLPTIIEILRGDSIAEVNRVVVNSQPGKEFRYSGGGSLIIQMAIMDILNQDFAAIARQEIFEPLGMRHSSFEQPLNTPDAAKAAWGYSDAPWYKGIPYVYPQQAAAGLYSTPTDLALLIVELQKCYAGKGSLLSQATVKEMFEPVATVSKGAFLEQTGLGVFLLEQVDNRNDNGRYFEHQGANAGFISLAIGSVTAGNGVVIMMNTGDDFNGFGTELRRAVASVYKWTGFLPPPIDYIKLKPATMKMYEGRYRKGPDEVLKLRVEKDYLVETINDGRNIYTFPVAVDTIVFTDYNIKGYFARNKDGNVVSIRNEYQSVAESMPKMRADEFTPSEHLKAARFREAKDGFRAMNMNEYQITYLAYDWINKKPLKSDAAKAILELASELFPSSSIVHARWGDYYRKVGQREKAIDSYRMVLQSEPGNKEIKEKLKELESAIPR